MRTDNRIMAIRQHHQSELLELTRSITAIRRVTALGLGGLREADRSSLTRLQSILTEYINAIQVMRPGLNLTEPQRYLSVFALPEELYRALGSASGNEVNGVIAVLCNLHDFIAYLIGPNLVNPDHETLRQWSDALAATQNRYKQRFDQTYPSRNER